jgi:Tfp pilus assembly protein PilN
MASSSKPTAVHFALVFFVMTTLILALVSYLTGKEYADKFAEAQTQNEDLNRLRTEVDKSLDEINTLKELLGYQFEDVGNPQETDNTVFGAAVQDLVNLGREQVQPSPQRPTVAATLQSLRAALDASQNQVSTQQGGLQETESRLEQELTAFRNRVQELQTSQEESEADLQRLVTERGRTAR